MNSLTQGDVEYVREDMRQLDCTLPSKQPGIISGPELSTGQFSSAPGGHLLDPV